MSDDEANRLIDYLMGTVYSIEDAVAMLELDIDSDDALDEIVNIIDQCLGCGRWHELSELQGTHNLYCDDCYSYLEE